MQKSALLLPVLLACSSLTVMAGATIAPGLPGLLSHFVDYPNSDYLTKLILTVPGLAIAITAPLAGWLADRFGRRVLLRGGVAIYIVAGSAGLWVDDLTLLLVSRFVLGIAVGFIMVCSIALLTDHFQGSERNRVMGIQSTSMAGGAIIFISAGSILADISWRAPFAVYLFPIALLPLIYKHVSKPPETVSGPCETAEYFPVLHAVLIYLLACLSMALFYFIPTQLPFYAQELGAESLKVAGFAVVVSQIFSALASSTYHRIRLILGHLPVLLLSYLLMMLGYLMLGFAESLAMVYLAMPLIGIGLGLNFPNLTIWLMSKIPTGMRGRASGGMTTAVFFGQFISPLISQPLVVDYGLDKAYLAGSAAMFALVLVPSALVLFGVHIYRR